MSVRPFNDFKTTNKRKGSPSLYEDWEARRRKLWSIKDNQHIHRGSKIDSQIEVYDYLLKRYQDSEIVNFPAKFPLPTKMEFHNRNILVMHHLSGKKKIETEDDAKERISSILSNFQNHHAEEDVPEAPKGLPNRFPAKGMLKSFRCWDSEEMKIKVIDEAEQVVKDGYLLSEELIKFLHLRLEGCPLDIKPGLVLVDCKNKSATEYIFSLWQDLKENDNGMPLALLLEERFLKREFRDESLKKIRIALASDVLQVRLGAVRILGKIGTLDDIGLLMDLLFLDEADVESLEEVECDYITATINKLAKSHHLESPIDDKTKKSDE